MEKYAVTIHPLHREELLSKPASYPRKYCEFITNGVSLCVHLEHGKKNGDDYFRV